MYVIHLKNIYFILSIVFIVSIVSLSTSQKKPESVATVALPVNNKVIILDARTWWRRWSEERVILECQKQI